MLGDHPCGRLGCLDCPDKASTGGATAGSISVACQEPTWAREYRVFCHKAMVQASAAELEATTRWATEEAFRFERDIVTELRGKAGQLEFGRWMHSIGRESHFEIEKISCPGAQLWWFLPGRDLHQGRHDRTHQLRSNREELGVYLVPIFHSGICRVSKLPDLGPCRSSPLGSGAVTHMRIENSIAKSDFRSATGAALTYLAGASKRFRL